jgi:hypothetical protein
MAQRSSDITETGLTRTDPDTENTALAADDASAQTESIRAQIEETRADMGETIDAIQDRLSFANISEQVSEQVSNAIETAKDTVYDATIGKAVYFMKNTGRGISNSSLVATAKENPLPFVLIGLGAGLLAYQGFSRRGNGRDLGFRRPNQLSGGVEEEAGSIIRSAKGGIRSVRDTVSNTAGSAYEGVSRVAESAIDSVTRAAATTYTGAGNLTHQAVEKAGDLGTRARETYDHYLEEKPWAIGAAALVAGAAIGMAIPSTRYEGELMGETRINLLNKVQESATEFIDKAKNAANEAGRAISEEAKTLTEETLG